MHRHGDIKPTLNFQHGWNIVDSLRGSSVKIGTIQRRLAWPLRKDDTHKSRSVQKSSSGSSRNILDEICRRWLQGAMATASASTATAFAVGGKCARLRGGSS